MAPISETIIDAELKAALGFELHTPDTDFARFDCKVVGCEATCAVVNTLSSTNFSPKINPRQQWVDGCIKPED